MRRILSFWNASLLVVVGITPSPVSGHLRSTAAPMVPHASDERFQAPRGTGGNRRPPSDTVTNHPSAQLVLGQDTLRLPEADSLVRIDLWLGYQYEEVGRQKEAESAYARLLSRASDSARAYAQTRLRAILGAEKAAAFRWVPRPFRPVVARLTDWTWFVEAVWLGLLVALLVSRRLAAQKGKTQVRIQAFTRHLPSSIGLGIEDTIADLHRRTNEVGKPVGVLLNSGLKLPVVWTAPSEDLVKLVEIVSPQPWIPKVLGWILKGSDNPRFLVQGHVEGTLWAVRVVVRLDDHGQRVRNWDRTVLFHQLLSGEQELACQVVYTLSECSL